MATNETETRTIPGAALGSARPLADGDQPPAGPARPNIPPELIPRIADIDQEAGELANGQGPVPGMVSARPEPVADVRSGSLADKLGRSQAEFDQITIYIGSPSWVVAQRPDGTTPICVVVRKLSQKERNDCVRAGSRGDELEYADRMLRKSLTSCVILTGEQIDYLADRAREWLDAQYDRGFWPVEAGKDPVDPENELVWSDTVIDPDQIDELDFDVVSIPTHWIASQVEEMLTTGKASRQQLLEIDLSTERFMRQLDPTLRDLLFLHAGKLNGLAQGGRATRGKSKSGKSSGRKRRRRRKRR